MYRSLKAKKDAYITDRIIKGTAKSDSNTGEAGSLDLFKLYGINKSGSNSINEISRLLVQFDLEDLRTDYSNGIFDITSPTFKCILKLHDIYGGQTTPRNFTIKAYPISHSWDEGRGRDIVYYQDQDHVNFITASYTNGVAIPWFASGANAKGLLGSSDIDLISSASLGTGLVNLYATQSFVDGTENLELDVTKILSATLKNQIPDYGFRISFDESQEEDNKTRFVKRFGSRQSVDANIRPQLIVKYDDSCINHQSSFYFDTNNTLIMKSNVRGTPSNIVSGSSQISISGPNCMLLKLWTYYSTSIGYQQYSLYATASQYRVGDTYIPGIYSASVFVPSTATQLSALINNARLTSSNTPLKFNQIWSSLDESVAYLSTSLYIYPRDNTVNSFRPRHYHVNIANVSDAYAEDDVVRFKTFIFDRNTPFAKFVKVPQEEKSLVLETHYSVRDVIADKTIIPFDTVDNSTRLSADGLHLYFDLWMDSLVPNRTYVIDIMIIDGGQQEIYYDASPVFRLVEN